MVCLILFPAKVKLRTVTSTILLLLKFFFVASDELHRAGEMQQNLQQKQEEVIISASSSLFSFPMIAESTVSDDLAYNGSISEDTNDLLGSLILPSALLHSSGFTLQVKQAEIAGMTKRQEECTDVLGTYCYGGTNSHETLIKRQKEQDQLSRPRVSHFQIHPRQLLLLVREYQDSENESLLDRDQRNQSWLDGDTFIISSGKNSLSLEGHRELFTYIEDVEEKDGEEDDEDEDEDKDEDDEEEEDTTPGTDCRFPEEWMVPNKSAIKAAPGNCDTIHELDPYSFSLINCGTSRCAFRVDDSSGNSVVVKIGMYNQFYEARTAYQDSWKDTIIMERLSWSPYILQIYGSCATTQVTEMAGGGNLLDFIHVARNYPDRANISPENKLKMAYHVMAATADMQQLERNNKEGFRMVAHNDLFVHQMLVVNGTIKLNDFHMASFAKRNFNKNKRGTRCREKPIKNEKLSVKTKSPDELHSYLKQSTSLIDRTKVDAWMAAEALYHILTDDWMYEGYYKDDCDSFILSDRTVDMLLPDEYREKFSHPAEQAIIDVIEDAWEFDFKRRPGARELADHLERELWILYGKDEGVEGDIDELWRFDIPPLPEDYVFQRSADEFEYSLACPLDDERCIEKHIEMKLDYSVTAL